MNDAEQPAARAAFSIFNGLPLTNYLQYRAPCLALPAARCRGLDSGLAEILKSQLHQLSRHCRALDIPIRPQLLRRCICLVRVYDAVWIVFRPQISLQPQDDNRQNVDALRKGPLDLVAPLKLKVSRNTDRSGKARRTYLFIWRR